jgi:hypothetical protein
MINNFCIAWDSSLTFRMTAVFLCYPKDEVWDPMAFSNNQQLLHCMGFFADAQNDNQLNVGFFTSFRIIRKEILNKIFRVLLYNNTKKFAF